MAVPLKTLVARLDELLEPGRFRDYCPNGLQVEGVREVSCLVSGVTASLALVEAAVELGADALLVHHGYFWRGESPVLVGMKRRRVAALLQADISLLAYHLPLDEHPLYGNNARLGALLEFETTGLLDPAGEIPGLLGKPREPMLLSVLLDHIAELTGRQPLLIGDADRTFSRPAWCTGAAQGYIEQAVSAGADVFISGEISEQTVHIAREEGIAYIAAGHHATERYGVQAVADLVAAEFDLKHRFIDIPNPV